MENTGQLNPTESLNIISKAIGQTKEKIKEQSFYYIMWGWIISVASFCNYLLVTFTEFKHDYLPWLILIPIGWILSISYSIKKEKTKKYETYFEVFLKYLWIVLGISFIVIVFISSQLKTNPTSFILLLAGIGTLVSGLTMKFKPLSFGGISFFFFAIASLFVSNSFTLLITSIAMIIGYLIPAYILKKSE
ncbi:hypothetical protein [Zobellia nedashkovskayae]|uniref:hypothetical protein n=1 Tax=Zobellia nedashkovskayae TaxID=2779510 RepID=UPI00188AA44F|nr:hypothetical protein [Zobellia nedashkovskayae]